MMGLTKNLSQSRQKIDAPVLLTGLAFWLSILALLLIFCWLAFAGQPPPARLLGEARINRIGDVLEWSAEAETITGIKTADAIHKDFFAFLPPRSQQSVRAQFNRAIDGKPYSFPRVSYRHLGSSVQVTFERRGDVCVAMLSQQ